MDTEPAAAHGRTGGWITLFVARAILRWWPSVADSCREIENRKRLTAIAAIFGYTADDCP